MLGGIYMDEYKKVYEEHKTSQTLHNKKILVLPALKGNNNNYKPHNSKALRYNII